MRDEAAASVSWWPTTLRGATTVVANVAAPVFPLILFFGAAAASVWPWRKRGGCWKILSLTVMAPYHEVTFRDGFVGDVLTSTVRPIQDIAFTAFYVLSGLQGWWSQSYSIDDAAVPVERSWLVHTVVLPACMISPLTYRFLQNLRQVYDNRQRWPYLGNATKYLLAAEVALFGVFDPSVKGHWVWIGCFVGATLYQVWWDVFMDWELLVWYNGEGEQRGQRWQCLRWWPFALRRTRLYESTSIYYSIFAINFLLRFCWTLNFIPMRYLEEGGTVVSTYGPDIPMIFGPMLASAEIIRRTLWGLLRVELEAIKTSPPPQSSKSAGDDDEEGRRRAVDDLMMSQEELKPMSIGQGDARTSSALNTGALIESDMSDLDDGQVMMELCLWATAFASLGIWAAARRQIM